MIVVHVVLFRPRADLSEAARRDLLEAIKTAAAEIPSLRRFDVGRRLRHGRPGYEQAMAEDYPFATILEFENRDGLLAYLAHPAHERLGRHFVASAEASLAYDYEMVDAARAADLDA